jgi:hypothetical protein
VSLIGVPLIALTTFVPRIPNKTSLSHGAGITPHMIGAYPAMMIDNGWEPGGIKDAGALSGCP